MNIQNLLKRNGGRLKFRKNPIKDGFTFRCQCCDNRANEQVVATWFRKQKRGPIGKEGRQYKFAPIAWAWVCPTHKKELKALAATQPQP